MKGACSIQYDEGFLTFNKQQDECCQNTTNRNSAPLSLPFQRLHNPKNQLLLLSCFYYRNTGTFEFMKILFIDNYDSFTFNLVQAFAKMGADIHAYRNDAITIEEARRLAPERIVISPGPKRPADAGISKKIIEVFGPQLPILGVCLGMQCINEVYGGKTIKAPLCVHGKTSTIFHTGKGIYQNVNNPFEGARYHSLIIDEIPGCLSVQSWTEENIPMGVSHSQLPVVGVQFHPESFLTEPGEIILEHFLEGRF